MTKSAIMEAVYTFAQSHAVNLSGRGCSHRCPLQGDVPAVMNLIWRQRVLVDSVFTNARYRAGPGDWPLKEKSS